MEHTQAPELAEPALNQDGEEMPLPNDPKSVFMGGLFLIALMWVLYVARPVVLPIVIAIVLKLLLQPLVRLLERVKVPKALGALVAILVLVGVLGGLGAILSSPASNIIRNIPDLITKVQKQVTTLKEFGDRAEPYLAPLGLTSESAGSLLSFNPGSLAGSVAGGASTFAGHLLETLLILFYMLVFGETFMRRLVEVLPRFDDKKQAVEISNTVERDISMYLLTITIINAVVGVLCAGVMWAFGIPGVLLWGVVAFCFNYVPILGPFAGVALFGAVGLATLGGSWYALLPAVCYLAIHFAEGELLTPMILAKRFTLNPIAVMVGLIFWYWFWGITGAILSVPLLAITKIVSDRIRPLRALGHMLEG